MNTFKLSFTTLIFPVRLQSWMTPDRHRQVGSYHPFTADGICDTLLQLRQYGVTVHAHKTGTPL